MKISEFWLWFAENEDWLFRFEEDMAPVFDSLGRELQKVDENISFEFGPIDAEGNRELVFTASGIRSAFPVVEQLVDSAPKIDRWKLVKFRQREARLFDVEYAGTQVNAVDVHYVVVRDSSPSKIGVLLFFENYSEDLKDIFGNISYLYLDQAIGEFNVETRVGVIEVFDRSSKYFASARPIEELGEHFDEVLLNLEPIS